MEASNLIKPSIVVALHQTTCNSMSVTFSDSAPPFLDYQGKESFFGTNPPLPEAVGWAVVVGFGALFSVITTIIVMISQKFGGAGDMTSEHFNTAGRSVKTGLTASVIVSQWTWAATLLVRLHTG